MTETSPLPATGPLKGLRVLDLTAVVLGPFATQTLGDWGADVIKVEALHGDTVRNSGVFRHRGMASVFLQINRNKRSVALDLKSDAGKAALLRLIPTVDVLVSNIRPAGMTRLGFGYETCRALNPRLIYAVATGFGQDGPWRARPAFDEIIQAASGFASAMGSDDEPQFVPSLLADKLTGMAVVSALFPIPKIALVPLFIIWFGIGESSKIITLAFGVFFPTVINTVAGVDGVPRGLIRMAQSFNLKRWSIVTKIVLPGALPAILSGFRITTSTAIILLVAAEMIGADKGIGAFVLQAGNLYDTDNLLAGIVVLSAIGLCVSWVLGRLERVLLGWR